MVRQLGAVNHHRSLIAWQRSHELALEVLLAARRLPGVERAEIGSQLRRAAVSAAANIAEGSARHGAAEFAHSLSVALGSLAEVDALLRLLRDLACLDAPTLYRLDGLRDRASAAAFALQRRLRASIRSR